MSISRLTNPISYLRILSVFCALCSVLCALRSAAAEAVEISVLSYNTHGLPAWIARDRPEQRFPQITKLAANYEIALFQENFVDANFSQLAGGLPGWFLERGNGSRAGWLSLLSRFCGSCGSGLTIAVAPGFAAELLERKGYGSCSGWLGGANDCWATKGFMAVRVTLPAGGSATTIDVYDLHLDAGNGSADHMVRGSQLNVLRAEIERLSNGRALIVGGDFNLDARAPRDRILLDGFAAALQLRHSGAGGSVTKWPEPLDHILYRAAAGVQLKVLAAGEAQEFVNLDQQPLSDHPAVFARFAAY